MKTISTRRPVPAGLAAALITSLALVLPSPARAAASSLPASDVPFPVPRQLLVWVGTGSASVLVDGAWQRVPSQDYEFTVTQRRYADRWESVKVQHRRHPAYDASAGPRDQVHYFRVDLPPPSSSAASLDFALRSSLGNGTGRIDAEFRTGQMEFDAAGVSMFAPFNRYRIDQQYRYEQGELLETVELFKARGGAETPFMRIEERALLMAPSIGALVATPR
jgi:hypothetical protein